VEEDQGEKSDLVELDQSVFDSPIEPDDTHMKSTDVQDIDQPYDDP
jgi:hypothetical protein